MWQQIFQAIKEIPDVIWSGVIAALIALGGVWLSNISNNSRLNLQLRHDADEKSKERVYSLRSNVYLGVAEYIETTNIHLSTLSGRDLTKLDMSMELQAIAGAMAKLKLVAGAETSKVATELGSAFGSVFLKLLTCLAPLQEEKTQIEIYDKLYHEATDEVKRIQHEIDKIVQNGDLDYLKYQALDSALNFNLEQSSGYAETRSEAYERHNIKLQEFNSHLMLEMKGVTEIQLRLMISARNDLGLESDSKELRRQLELQWSVMQAAYKDSIAKLNN